MKIKYEVNVKVKVDSLDSVPGLLHEVANLMMAENSDGTLEKQDGDFITWKSDIK
jgi:hypothetical protein